MVNAITKITLCIYLLAFPIIIFAQEKSDLKIEVPQEIKEYLEQPGLVPGSPMYSVKRFFEKVGDFFTVGKARQGERDLKIAIKRLSESNVLLEKGQLDKAADLMNDYRDRLNKGGELIKKLKNDEKSKQLFEKLSDLTKNNQNYLEKVSELVPKNWQNDFKKALTDSVKWNEIAEQLTIEIMTRLKKVGENIMNTGQLSKEVDQELEEKLLQEKDRESN